MATLSDVLKNTAATIIQQRWRNCREAKARRAAAVVIQRSWRSYMAVRLLSWDLQMGALQSEFQSLMQIRPASTVTAQPFGLSPPPTVMLPQVVPYYGRKRVLVIIPPEDADGFLKTVATVCPHAKFTCMPPPSNGLFKQNTKLISAVAAADCVVWSAHGCAGDGCIVLLPVHHKQFKFAALPVRDLVEQLADICGPSALSFLFLDVCYGLMNVAAEPVTTCSALSVCSMEGINVYGYATAPLQTQSPLGLASAMTHWEQLQ
tara:strand:- start:12337 stop:13122 length:786 start_codon:yes stop_codon:yes gene_type:complete